MSDLDEKDEFGMTEQDYLPMRLQEDFVRGFDYSNLEGDYDNQIALALSFGFEAGYNTALPQWVKEADVPQEWREGTDMLVYVDDCRCIAFWGKTAHVPLYGWLDPSTFDGEGCDLMNPQPEYVCQLPKGPE